MTLREVRAEDYHWGTDEGPAAVVEEVRRACVAAEGQDPLDEASVLHLKHRGLAGARLWLAEGAGGSGFAFRHGPEDDPAVDLAVAPAARGHGWGRALAEAALGATGPVTAWSHGDHPAAARLAAAYSLARVRELWVMRRDATRPVGDLVVPDGLQVRSFTPSDAGEVLRVNAAAFAAHPEQGAMDEADLAERMGEDWFDPAGLLVAVEPDGRLLGFHWTKRHSAELGEVYVVGIDPAAQGRGLGTVLTGAGLRHLAETGVREVLLYVESDNAAAVALYSGLGFGHAAADTHVQYARG